MPSRTCRIIERAVCRDSIKPTHIVYRQSNIGILEELVSRAVCIHHHHSIAEVVDGVVDSDGVELSQAAFEHSPIVNETFRNRPRPFSKRSQLLAAP